MLKDLNHKIFECVESTHLYLLENKEGEDLIVTAEKQSAGKTSKEDQQWESEKGGLYLSIRFTDRYLMRSRKKFSNDIGYEIAQALSSISKTNIVFKTPNDFYIGDFKIGGSLISYFNLTCIYSLGINVNQKSFSQPLSNKATSLFLQTESEYDISQILNIVLNKINDKLKEYRQDYPIYSKPLKTKKFKGKL